MRLKDLIVQNIFWRGLYFLSLFVLNILISRYFKAEGSGWVYYVINNLSLLLLITGISLESGASYYTSKNEISHAKIAGFCFFWAFVATLMSIVILKITQIGSSNNFTFTTEYFVACGSYVLGFLLINYFSALYFAKQNFFTPNLILLSANLLMIFLIAAYGNNLFIHQHFIIIYFSSFLSQGLVLAIAYFSNDKNLKKPRLLSTDELKKIFRYSLIALFANVIFFLVYRVDYWFVKRFCNGHDLGNYIQVSKLGQIFMLVPTMLAAVIFPRTASGLHFNLNDSLQALSRILFSFYFIIIATVIISGKWLFPFLYGSSFDEMYYPFLLLSPGILSLSTLALVSAYFAGKNKLAANLAGSIISLIIIATGDIMFIPKYGIKAAATVSSAGYICYLVYNLYFFKKEYKSNTIDFFILKKSDINYISRLFKKATL